MPSARVIPGALVVCLVFASSAPWAAAQEFRATITGRVVDASGATIPGVTVTATNEVTNAVSTVVTSEDGAYTIPFLPPGDYTLVAELEGFKKYEQAKIGLQVGQTATVNIQLSVGEMAETVSVTADTIEASRADRGTVIDSKRVTEIPLNTRNPFMLSLTSAGITFNGPAIYHRPFDNGAIADWSINGGWNRNNEFTLDGAPNNSIAGGNNVAYVPPVDAVQEFKIVTNSYDAQHGRSAGGSINVSLKSGSNDFHGAIYEFYRRKWLDSNWDLLELEGEEKPDHKLDQYGIQLDGPIFRDKTFFMVNWEGYQESNPNIETEHYPDADLRRGDFSHLRDASGNLITIYDPATGRFDGTGQWVRNPFANNMIPQDRINPIAQRLLDFWPMPNQTPDEGCASYRCNFLLSPNLARDDFYNLATKVDHVFSEKTKMFVRYAQNKRTEDRSFNGITGPAEDSQGPLERINYTGVWDWVRTMSPSFVLNLRSGLNQYVEAARTDAGLGFDATELGFPAELVNALPQTMFPRIDLVFPDGDDSEFTNLGRGNFSRGTTTVYSFQPNFSWLKGNHNVRGGLDMRLTWLTQENSGSGGAMRIRFDDRFTRRDWDESDPLSGSSFASFLLGIPTHGEIDNNIFPTFRWNYFAPWIQDDWKITNRLTLNLGLRWDLNSPVWEEQKRLAYAFDPAIVNPANDRIDHGALPGDIMGGLRFIGGPNAPDKYPYGWDHNNLQPRAGFAFLLNDVTIVKGGYGLYFMNPSDTTVMTGYNIPTPIVSSLDGGQTPSVALDDPFPQGVVQPPGSSLGAETNLGQEIDYSNPGFEIPYVHQFHIGVQRLLPWDASLELSYVGSRSRKLRSQWAGVNEPSAEFRDACNPALGGDPDFCRERVPNPFFGVSGFDGTSLYESETIDRFALNRPFPQFEQIEEFERNDGSVRYNSFQAVLNKRFSDGVTINATYTFSRMVEQWGWLDVQRMIPQEGLYWSDRPHRVTLSAVYELPIGRGRALLGESSGLLNALVSGWEVAGLFVYNSGRPWDIDADRDGNRIYYDPNGERTHMNPAALNEDIDYSADIIRAVTAPCTARYEDSGELVPREPYADAGCTEPWFISQPSFGTNVLPLRDWDVRRPPYRQVDINFAKMTQLTANVRLQLRVEVFNLFNVANYDEANFNQDLDSPLFGTIDKSSVRQSGFPRQVQLGVKLLW
ncbi:MAG: carboxypeptidase regulatory-like domain-containing protein [Vicinamibacteraceae bacterium]